LLCGSLRAQQVTSDSWGKLLDAGKVDDAEKLCKSWQSSGDVVTKTEALKCLANVALQRGQILSLQGNDAGGGYLGEGYKPEAVDAAVAYLDEALKLSPQDISIHKGRLYILETSLRFDDMAKALDQSIQIYQGKRGATEWISYSYEIIDKGLYHPALEILAVLEKYYPDSNEVLGNTGACLMILHEDEKALPYLQRAAAISPNDPIDVWNVGQANNHLGNYKTADLWYQKALALPPSKDEGVPKDMVCLYGKFVDEKLHDKARACTFEERGCEKEDRKACTGH